MHVLSENYSLLTLWGVLKTRAAPGFPAGTYSHLIHTLPIKIPSSPYKTPYRHPYRKNQTNSNQKTTPTQPKFIKNQNQHKPT